MQVPTGGKAHKPIWLIRCDSEADGTVRMKEESYNVSMLSLYVSALCFQGGFFYF